MKVFLQLPQAWDKIHMYHQQPNCLWLELALDKGKNHNLPAGSSVCPDAGWFNESHADSEWGLVMLHFVWERKRNKSIWIWIYYAYI